MSIFYQHSSLYCGWCMFTITHAVTKCSEQAVGETLAARTGPDEDRLSSTERNGPDDRSMRDARFSAPRIEVVRLRLTRQVWRSGTGTPPLPSHASLVGREEFGIFHAWCGSRGSHGGRQNREDGSGCHLLLPLAQLERMEDGSIASCREYTTTLLYIVYEKPTSICHSQYCSATWADKQK